MTSIGVDVIWNYESVNDHRHSVGIEYRFNLRASLCICIHKCTYAYTRKLDNTSGMIIYCNEKGVPYTSCLGKQQMLVGP